MSALRKQQNTPCFAIIVDMVKSRNLGGIERQKVQGRFQGLVQHLNKQYAKDILSAFVITLGDEFQGLLHSSISIPAIMWDLEDRFPDRSLRSGVGFGPLHTGAPKVAINVDGPCLHNARSAIEKAKHKSLLGGVFAGFGTLDPILDGFARMLWFHRSVLTRKQRAIFRFLRDGETQTEIAKKLKIVPQTVWKQVKSSGWEAYFEGETAWTAMFEEYVDPMTGVRHH